MQSASFDLVFMEKERLKRRVRLCDILRVLRKGDVSGVATLGVASGVNGLSRSVQFRRRVIIGLWRLSGDVVVAVVAIGSGAEDVVAVEEANFGNAGGGGGAAAGGSSSSSRMILLLQRGLAGREDVLPDESIAV